MFRCIFTITSGAVTDESAVTVPASPNAGVANNLPDYCVRVFLSLLPLSCLTLPLFVMDTKMQENIGRGGISFRGAHHLPWDTVTGGSQPRGGQSPGGLGVPPMALGKKNKN